mmetsp:Transcript_2182/g.3207  ORF Transcript_2182/g.3207 Transcript_2182/m.3207 type:complete len:157 (+) Transcript_2182:143-613(+)
MDLLVYAMLRRQALLAIIYILKVKKALSFSFCNLRTFTFMRKLCQTKDDQASSVALTFQSRCSIFSLFSVFKLEEEASERKDDFNIVATLSSFVVLRVRVNERRHRLSSLKTFQKCTECWKTLMTTKMVMMMVLLDDSLCRLHITIGLFCSLPKSL